MLAARDKRELSPIVFRDISDPEETRERDLGRAKACKIKPGPGKWRKQVTGGCFIAATLCFKGTVISQLTDDNSFALRNKQPWFVDDY